MTTHTLMAYILVVSSLALVGLLVRRLTRFDLSISCLLAGFAASLVIPWLEIDTGIRAHNIQELVFYIILPLLIFISAWHLSTSLMQRWFSFCFLLATLGMLLTVAIASVGMYYGIAHPLGFPWMAALIAATILSATDPVSVASQLKAAHASDELLTIFEGESLFNDATVVVIFGFLLSLALGNRQTGSTISLLSVLPKFFITLLGGISVGAAVGFFAVKICVFIADKAATVIVMVMAAFGSFYLAEGLWHVSGIMSVMTAAIMSRILLRHVQCDEILVELRGTFEWMELLLNGIIFSLLGLLVTWGMFVHQWKAMMIAIIATLIARSISVFTFASVFKTVSWRWAGLLSWGGLKGAIAIVLVLSLPVELEYWWTIQSMVFGVVLFSLVVQGGSFPWLIKRAQIAAPKYKTDR